MQPLVLKFGLSIGLIVSLVTTGPFIFGWEIPHSTSELIGYSTILLSSASIYFAIRYYKSETSGLSFGTGFKLGLYISVLGGLVFAVTTFIFHSTLDPEFAQNYFEYTMEQKAAAGMDAAQLAEERAQWESNRELFTSPAFNALLMFMTIFPAGLLITIISAALLRDPKQ